MANKKDSNDKRIKVILVISPSNLNKTQIVSTQYPINLGYIASYIIKNNNALVTLLDYNALPYSDESFNQTIKDINPDIVGFSCYTINIKIGHHLASLVKNTNKDILTVVAGPHSTALPKETMDEFPNFDVIVKGEGEITISELCNRVMDNKELDGCLGIVHRVNGEVKIEAPRPLIENLDELPFPKRDLADLSLYNRSHTSRGLSRKFLNISEFVISRGCPFECIFCGSHLAYKRVIRYRSPENVIAEMEECINKYGTNHFSILDDTLTLNHNIIYALCKELKRLGITWDCNTRVSAVTQELLNEMAQSGCIKVSFGVESGSQRIINLNKKLITIEQVKKAFDMAHKAKIKYVEGTFMIGSHPDEKPEDVKETIKLIKEIKPDLISLSVVVPLPGTEIYELLKQNNLIFAKEWDEFMFVAGTPKWRTFHFTPEELVKWQRKGLMAFYFTPNYIFKRLSEVRSFGELKYWTDIGMNFIKAIVFQQKANA